MLIFCYFSLLFFVYFLLLTHASSFSASASLGGDFRLSGFTFFCFLSRSIFLFVCLFCFVLNSALLISHLFSLINLFKYKFVDLVVRFLL